MKKRLNDIQSNPDDWKKLSEKEKRELYLSATGQYSDKRYFKFPEIFRKINKYKLEIIITLGLFSFVGGLSYSMSSSELKPPSDGEIRNTLILQDSATDYLGTIVYSRFYTNGNLESCELKYNGSRDKVTEEEDKVIKPGDFYDFAINKDRARLKTFCSSKSNHPLDVNPGYYSKKEITEVTSLQNP